MKKVSLLILVSMILLLAFASCSLLGDKHEHEWAEATCSTPKTCSCGETEGEALGHDWTEATCTAPATCKTCEATDGEALGHNWRDATCTAPKTCIVCNDTEGTPLGHKNDITLEAVAPTCTATGLTEGTKCSVCQTVTTEQEVVPALGHTEEVVLGHDSTCAATGLTDGKKCSVCDTVLVEQDIIPTKAHTEVDVLGYAATCTTDGLTDGKQCSVCETFTVAQTTIFATGHLNTTKYDGKDATCAEAGYSASEFCNDCSTWIVEKVDYEALAHTPWDDPQKENIVEATCAAPGGYDMVDRCVYCDAITSSVHTDVPKLDHKWVEYTHDAGSEKCGVDGTKTATCVYNGCSVTNTITDEGTALEHAMADDAKCGEHWTCTRGCGYTSEEPLAHTWVPATCIAPSYCPNCGTDTGEKADHTPGSVVVENEVDPKCEVEGSFDEVVYCTFPGCGEELSRVTKPVAATGHNMLPATCDDPSTCANGCGKTDGDRVATHTPVATVGNGVLTYNCTTCGDSFTTDQLISYVGNDKSDLFFTKNGDPSVSIVDGAYSITAGEQRSQYMIYGPSNDKNHKDTMTGWNSTNNSFGVLSFRIQPGTITEAMRVIVMSSRNNPNWDANKLPGSPDAWSGNSLDILRVVPNGDGTYKIDGASYVTSNVFLNNISSTDWVNVEIFMNINADGLLTIAYYINGEFFNTYTRDLLDPDTKQTIKNLDINNFYMCGWTAPGTGFAIDDMYFGYQKNAGWLFNEHKHTWADATCEVAKHCTACGLTEGSALGHTNATRDENVVAPDCVNNGHHDVVTYCSVCNKELGRETVTDAALGHLEQVVPGTPATCTENGISDGKICTREGCKTPTLVAQAPIQATGHTDADNNKVCDECDTSLDCDHVGTGRVTIPGTAATCTATGLTSGEKCEICGEITTAQTEIPALGHTPAEAVRENVTLPTCTEAGKYDSVVYCSVCTEMVSETKDVVDPALGHAEVSHDAKAPTCTDPGNKAYVTCSRCDYTTFESVPATGHSYSAPNCAAAQTCTVCGATKGEPNVNAHNLTSAYAGGKLTYTCSRCDYAFNVDTFDYSDGTNYNGMHANASQNNTVYTTNPDKANYPVMKDGYLEFIRTDAEAGVQKQLQMWLPSANGGTNKFSGFTAASNSIGYLAFKVDAKTDVNFEMKLVDHRVDSLDGTGIRWGDQWCINDPVFRVMPTADGKTELRGFNGVSLGKFTVDANGFTGWVDVAIQIVLDPDTDKVIAHYYINGAYVTTASRDLTTWTNAIQGVYINFNSKAAGCGYRIDNLTFGYSAHKHNFATTVNNGVLTYECACGTDFVVSSEVREWNGDGSDSALKNVPNGNVKLDVVDGKYEYIFKPATNVAPDFSADGTQSGDGWFEYDKSGYAGGQLQMWMPSNNRDTNTLANFSCENDSVGVISFNVKSNLARHPDWDTALTFSVGKPRNAADWNDSNGDGVADSWSDDSINIFTIEEYQASGVVVKGGLNGTNLNLTTIPVDGDGWSEWFNVMIVIEMTKEEYINVYYYINGALLGTDSRDLNNPGGARTLNPKKIEALQISGWTYVPDTGIVFDDFYFGYTAGGHNTLDGQVHKLTETTCGVKSTCVCGWTGYTVAHTFATDCAPACSVCGLANEHATAHANLVATAVSDGVAYVCSDCGYCYNVKSTNGHNLGEISDLSVRSEYDRTYDGTYIKLINLGTENAQHQMWVPGQTESAKFADCSNANASTVFLSFSINAKDHHNTGIEFKVNANRNTSDWGGPTNNGWSNSSVGIFKVKPTTVDATSVALTGYNGADLGSIAITGENGWTGWMDVVVVMHLNTDNTITVEYYINGSLFKTLHADFVIWTHEINSLYINGRTNEGQGFELKNFFFGYTNAGMSQYQAPLYKEVIAKEDVTNAFLASVATNKIKQWDQSNAHNDSNGTPVFVVADKNGDDVQGLYFSKTTPWVGDEKEQFSEFRLSTDGSKKATSISFDYIIRGTIETNDRYIFKDLEGNEFSADAYVQIKTPVKHELAGDDYPELSGTDLILDGEWHTMTYTFETPLEIINVLFNLYHFQGELIIANFNVEYAKDPFYNSVIDVADVQSESLKTIVASKIKQCDQSNPGSDPSTDLFAEGGTPVYVLANGKDGSEVEALYISRTVAWTGKETKQLFTEFRFAINGEKAGPAVTSISFDYKIDGTVEENNRFTFTDLEGNNFSADAYVQVKTPSTHALAGDNYPELSGTDLILDGEWHTMTYTFDEPIVLIDFLVNLYQFQGEMLISNIQVNCEG